MDSNHGTSSNQKTNIETIEDTPKYEAFETENVAGKDRAAELLQSSHEQIIVSEADNGRILRRIDLMVLPIMLGVYFLQQLDKSTLSYASVFGLVKDAHLGGQDYSWLGSIVYVAQLVMQPIIAYFLVKLPTGKFAGIMVFCWGVVLSCMCLGKDFKGLLAARFFLQYHVKSLSHFIFTPHPIIILIYKNPYNSTIFRLIQDLIDSID
ncbi:hypothetical protein BDZ45DRAFT_740201 [Acephala macrosclerotiorum]|nr:hypothetical protein BDZ45DRAFT_740201 [Acephala macrosclerotiorum]